MNNRNNILLLVFILLLLITSCRKQSDTSSSNVLQIKNVTAGTTPITLQGPNKNIPADSTISLYFDHKLDTSTVSKSIIISGPDKLPVDFISGFSPDFTVALIRPRLSLNVLSDYTLSISSGIKGAAGESYPGAVYSFTTATGKLKLETITVNSIPFPSNVHLREVNRNNVNIQLRFSQPLDTANSRVIFSLSGNQVVKIFFSADFKSVTINNSTALRGYSRYYFTVMNSLKGKNGFSYDGYYNYFFSSLDSTQKFPTISDDELLTLIQQKTFSYFYDFAHPACGMARERNSSGDVVTTGGSGFGIMALVVGMNRNFITREQGMTRLSKILGFLCAGHSLVSAAGAGGALGLVVVGARVCSAGELRLF